MLWGMASMVMTSATVASSDTVIFCSSGPYVLSVAKSLTVICMGYYSRDRDAVLSLWDVADHDGDHGAVTAEGLF